MHRRMLLAATAALAAPHIARAEDTPGVTPTEIRFGGTTALQGPVSALGVQCRAVEGVCRMVNEQGGIAGRKLSYILMTTASRRRRRVEQTRRLIEQDHVAFLFNMLGTAPNNAVVRYVNQRKVPHLFLSVNGDKWGDYKEHPWTMGFAPSARVEAQVFARHALSEKADARFALLYQNDDFGRDYVAGLKDVLGGLRARVRAASYEVTDPTVDSQLIALQGRRRSSPAAPPNSPPWRSASCTSSARRRRTTSPAAPARSPASSIPAGVERAVGTVSSAF